MNSVRKAREHHRPVLQVGKQHGRHRAVVLDEVALRVALFRPEDLLLVRELYLARGGVGRHHRRRHLTRSAARHRAIRQRLVLAQSQEHRLAEQALFGPLRVADLGRHAGLDPDVAAAGGQRTRARGGGDAIRLQPLGQRKELLLRETAARAADVDELVAVEPPEVQGPEADPRPFGRRKAHHHEVARVQHAQLQPVGAAPAAISGRRLLRDDTFEAAPLHLGPQRLAVSHHVIGKTQRAARRQDAPQGRLAGGERQVAQVEAVVSDQVEGVVGGGMGQGGAGDVGRAGDLRPFLQTLEHRPALVVAHDDLAVEHEAAVRQRLYRLGDLREQRRRVVAAAVTQAHASALLCGEQAVAVELQLEDPVRARKRAIGGLRQHDLHRIDGDRALAAPRVLQLLPERLRPFARLGQLLDEQPRDDRLFGEPRRLRVRPGVAVLDEQPFLARLGLAGAFGAHQRPDAAELVAVQLEEELALQEPLLRRLQGDPAAAVPHDGRSGAVVAVGDHAFVVGVFDGMVFDLHRHPLLRRVRREAPRHRPGHQHPVHLQAEIVVQPPGRVFLHHEEPIAHRGRRGGRAHRLAGAVRPSFGVIGAKPRGLGRGRHKQFSYVTRRGGAAWGCAKM